MYTSINAEISFVKPPTAEKWMREVWPGFSGRCLANHEQNWLSWISCVHHKFAELWKGEWHVWLSMLARSLWPYIKGSIQDVPNTQWSRPCPFLDKFRSVEVGINNVFFGKKLTLMQYLTLLYSQDHMTHSLSNVNSIPSMRCPVERIGESAYWKGACGLEYHSGVPHKYHYTLSMDHHSWGFIGGKL